MTVVIGQRPVQDVLGPRRSDDTPFRSGESWEMRRERYHETLVPVRTVPTSPAAGVAAPDPVPAPRPVAKSRRKAPAGPDPVRPGLMKMYASRMAHAQVDLASIRRTSGQQRLLAGERQGDDGPIRSLAIVDSTLRIGRSSESHYRNLHPNVSPRFDRLRCGGEDAVRAVTVGARQFTAGLVDPFAALVAGVRALYGASGGLGQTRTGASRRAVVAVLAAMLVLASVASTGLAEQFRYTVQAGDSINSIAETFGVDPEAIRRSSYLPNGDTLSAGQVLIIPAPGQTPGEAARMAAEREGTSPWVATAHWVESGENPASIAARYGVSLQALLDINDIADPHQIVPGTRILIPARASGTSDAHAVKVNVPSYKQSRNLSCEYAATHAAAMAFGWAPSEQVFIDSVPKAINPHRGYRGNIDGRWGNTDDYGVYAAPLVPVLNAWDFHGEVMYTFGDVEPLKAHLDAGHPVVTWLAYWGDTRVRMSDDGNYSLFAGMHVVTVYGYDSDGVWVMDPAKGEKAHYSWGFFVQMWSVIDGMSLAVYPR